MPPRTLSDLRADPFQLDNRIRDADPALVAALSAHVGRLARSTADQCRELEDLPLPDLQPSAKLHASAGLVETLSTGERQLE